MHRKWMIGLLAVAAAGAVAIPAAAAMRDTGDAVLVSSERSDRTGDGSQQVVGLTGKRTLVSFRTKSPGDVRRIGAVDGLIGDTRLIGIDFRVQDGRLYGVGEQGGIYTIGVRDARATKVSQLTVALAGDNFGVDFNPAANRLRVVSETGQNLRHNIDDPAGTPAAGTTANDTMLTTPPAMVATTGVTGAAYTNNDTVATTATTLFDVNVMTDQIAVQSPANQGELAPTGALGVDADADAGIDIYTTLRDGAAAGNAAFATLKVDGGYRLYRANLLTGRVSPVGRFPGGAQVRDLAVTLDS